MFGNHGAADALTCRRPAAIVIETVGIGIIALSALWSLAIAVRGVVKRSRASDGFRSSRKHLGSGILLGLEFLVAADIINTVAVDLNYRSIGILSIIVLIRTFLSVTLEMETTGRWPWARVDTRAGEG